MPKTPARVRLVSWNEDTAQVRAHQLTGMGFSVDASSLLGRGGVIGHFREAAPDAVVLDLDRLPSHGREVGVVLRSSRSTRHLPLIFAGGDSEKVERIRVALPDAVFTSWDNIADAVRHAMAHPVATPIKPTPHMERWAGASLSRKLDIKPGTQVAVLGVFDGFPGGFEGFAELLGDLPVGTALVKRFTPKTQLTLNLWERFGNWLPLLNTRRHVCQGHFALDHSSEANEDHERGLQPERCSRAWTGEWIRRLQGVRGEQRVVRTEVRAEEEVSRAKIDEKFVENHEDDLPGDGRDFLPLLMAN